MIRERREAMNISQAELARRVGIAQPSLHNIETNRTKRSRYMPDIFRELGLDPRTGLPADEKVAASTATPSLREPMAVAGARRDFPVYYMQPEGEGMVLTVDPVETIERPALLNTVKDAFGVCVNGEENHPVYKAGDIVFVHPYTPPIVGTEVVLRSAAMGDNRIVIGELTGVTAGEWEITQYRRGRKLSFSRKEFPRCDRIIGKYNRR